MNKVWLTTGEGEMLIENTLPITKLDSESETGHLVPFYDDVITKGSGGGSGLYDSEGSHYPTEYIHTGGWFNNATGAIRHYGDSMIEYPSGCILAFQWMGIFSGKPG